MRTRRYQVREELEVNASVERVYAVAADPACVPLYAPEIARIELIEKVSARTHLVRSHIRVGALTLASLYRYNYRPPTHYSGVQERGRLLRGYFSLTFQPRGGATLVAHTEGFISPVPFLARALGFVYFRLLARGGVRTELERLKQLVEREPQD